LIFVGHGSLLELRLLSYKIICGNARLYDKYKQPAEGKRAFLPVEGKRIKGREMRLSWGTKALTLIGEKSGP
jgi:hypothetical protein